MERRQSALETTAHWPLTRLQRPSALQVTQLGEGCAVVVVVGGGCEELSVRGWLVVGALEVGVVVVVGTAVAVGGDDFGAMELAVSAKTVLCPSLVVGSGLVAGVEGVEVESVEGCWGGSSPRSDSATAQTAAATATVAKAQTRDGGDRRARSVPPVSSAAPRASHSSLIVLKRSFGSTASARRSTSSTASLTLAPRCRGEGRRFRSIEHR